jgi:hypothetical protein
MKPKTRLVRGHVRGCAAKQLTMAGQWDTAWGVVVEKYRSFKHGRSGTTKPYVVLGCNDPDCPAEIAIRLDAITALLPRW